ncbi:MAG TPA: poly(R)-hydroxyalkanoic acid synthase subunit PhaE [Thermodesulfobacteriota bacterium]
MSNEDIEHGEYYKRFYDIWEKSMLEALNIWKKNSDMNIKNEGDKSTEFDIVEYYKKFYETWEKTTSEALEKYINSPLFALNMGKFVEKSSELKKYFDEIVEKSLKNLRLPSKNDIDRIHSSINTIEAKINDLSEMVEELKSSKKPSKKR